MVVPRGKTRKIILMVGEIEELIAKAVSNIDTKNQYEIRSLLEEAIEKCVDIRNMYDPI